MPGESNEVAAHEQPNQQTYRQKNERTNKERKGATMRH